MNFSLENINICFILYFVFISEQFAGPNISKSTDMTNVTRPSPGAKPHFRLIISYDEYGNLNSELDKGNPICPPGQY